MRPTPVCDKIDALAASTAMSMPYAGSPSQVDSAGQPPGVALIGGNLSQCERQAGHPPGVALLYTPGSHVAGRSYIVGPPLAGGLRRGWPAAGLPCNAGAQYRGRPATRLACNAGGLHRGCLQLGWPAAV